VVTLTPEDRRELIELLSQLPELESPAGRRALLDLAGLGSLAPRIDLGGPTFLAVHAIVSHLTAFGQVTPGKEALGLFLSAVQPLVGIERSRLLTGLIERYSMMVPESELPTITGWRGADDPSAVEEKIIGANTLRPVAFLMQALRASRAVAYLEVNAGGWSGSGFLVSEDLLLTNSHVIPRSELLKQTTIYFNYECDEDGVAKPTAAFRARPGGL
jgi:hypothetical protein